MKKVFIAALLVAGLSGFAQKKDFSNKILEKMTQELALTAEQQEKLKPILEEQIVLKKDNKLNPANIAANHTKMKENKIKMKAILTPEQLEKQKANRLKIKGETKE